MSAQTGTVSGQGTSLPKASAKSNAGAVAATVSAKPVHPMTLTTFTATGCELSTWAYLTVPRPLSVSSITSTAPTTDTVLPNLVVAHGNCLRIYTVDPTSGTLILASSYERLAGNIVTLNTLPSAAGHVVEEDYQGVENQISRPIRSMNYDGLLLGFAGHPRLSVVYAPHSLGSWSGVLSASSILDLTPALLELSHGSLSPLDHDLICVTTGSGTSPIFDLAQPNKQRQHLLHQGTTVAVILGGGVGVAVFELYQTIRSIGVTHSQQNISNAWWNIASAPYLLPLPGLYHQLVNRTSISSFSSLSSTVTASKTINKLSTGSISTVSHGFGDILALDFLHGFTEPTLVLLHTNPNNGKGGLAWSGRMAHRSSSCRTPLTLTAISVGIAQQRSVVLWALRDAMPADAWEVKSHPSNGILVVGVNEVVFVDNCGRILCALAVNGWVRATCSSMLISKNKDLSSLSGKGRSEENTTIAQFYQKNSGKLGGLIQPNPSPLPKLAIQLDGSRLLFVSDCVALVSLRDGTLYSLEIHDINRRPNKGVGGKTFLSLSPVGRKIGALGMISSLSFVPLANIPASSGNRLVDGKLPGVFQQVTADKLKKEDLHDGLNDTLSTSTDNTLKFDSLSLGLFFAGSRLGDSSLFFYNLKEHVKLLPWRDQDVTTSADNILGLLKRKQSNDDYNRLTKPKIDASHVTDDNNQSMKVEAVSAFVVSDDDETLTEDEKLRREEDWLYNSSSSHSLTFKNLSEGQGQHVSDEENGIDKQSLLGIQINNLSRPHIRYLSLFDSIHVLDSLTGVGPIGPGCKGPLAWSLPNPTDLFKARMSDSEFVAAGSATQIHPCGYDTSGGLVLVTSPGMNHGSTIISEIDCDGIVSAFSCVSLGYIFLTRSNGGCILLRSKVERVEHSANDGQFMETCFGSECPGTAQLIEVDVHSWNADNEDISEKSDSEQSVADAQFILTKMNIFFVNEIHSNLHLNSPRILMLSHFDGKYVIVIMSTVCLDKFELKVEHFHVIGGKDPVQPIINRGLLKSVSMAESLDGREDQSAIFACRWDNSHVSIFDLKKGSASSSGWTIKESVIESRIEDGNVVADSSYDDDQDVYKFYASDQVRAIDLFSVSETIFGSSCDGSLHQSRMSRTNENVDLNENNRRNSLDEFDLYGDDVFLRCSSKTIVDDDVKTNYPIGLTPCRYNTLGTYTNEKSPHPYKMYISLFRQSGRMEILDVAKLISHECDDSVHLLNSDCCKDALVWFSPRGCGHGVPTLTMYEPILTTPKMHKVTVSEAKLFFSGPSLDKNEHGSQSAQSVTRSLCLLIETSDGDLHLYTGTKSSEYSPVAFVRLSLDQLSRPSKEEGRHYSKLKRKGIITDTSSDISATAVFRNDRLHRFFSISGQDGLFAATSRPLWFISERGTPYALCHRLRHAAPAGGRSLPLSGFCHALSMTSDSSHNNGFLTVHERIGRVGSQRITLFSGLSDIFATHGILPGGGVALQKIPLGVTVRKLAFIDDVTISSVSHPIYALLISRVTDGDQNHLSDDGIHASQRRIAREEREKEKTRRQVEADLGGFDVEQEWVEEIERDDCFEVEKKFGGAPPIATHVYEIWLVDAAGWSIVDTFQLSEFEHGLSMEFVTLSDIPSDDVNKKELMTKVFLAVGTGIIDNDGEDISSKGRILLFDLKRAENKEVGAEISLVYDKEISVGPVMSLQCLSCENRNRLIVGAGAEITVEQWGSNKLTQVGFFHCHMQVLHINIFKTFLLLADAYDSIYFLVWRESDKSLTLLAKDYEPTEVYSSGLISRGGSLGFVCLDDRQNLQLFSYAPGDPAARGGNKLVCRADFHLGSQTLALQNHLCRSSLIINSANEKSTIAALKHQDTFFGKGDDDIRFAVNFGTSDGGFGTVVPINENIFWRLTALQSIMSNAVDSDCALSRRSWRLYRRTTRRGSCRSNDRKKGVVDGDLVIKFSNMSLMEQEDLASAIGSTVDLILDNLIEVVCAASVV